MMTAIAQLAEGAVEQELPLGLSPLGFGIIAMIAFAAMFGFTWAFRNFGKKQQ